MSWRAYDLLTVQPDFSNPPALGLGDGGMTTVEIGQASIYGAWHGDTDLALAFQYRFETAAEQRTLRNFFNGIAGRAVPFFVPTWEPDYRLTAAATAGAMMIQIENAGIHLIDENRPDTPGRQIFIVTTDGQVQGVGVVAATDAGANEILTLDLPLAFDIEPTTCMVGKLRLVRMADDRAEFKQMLPGHGDVQFRMVTARQTRHVNENPNVESEQVFSLKAFDDVILTDENPILYQFQNPQTVGPNLYGVPQGDNYYREWSGHFEGTDFIMNDGVNAPVTSDLYDSAFQADHIKFAFDASSKEAVAWRKEPDVIRIGWKASGINHWLDFAGISPLLFQTWTIDGTISAGAADLVVFYIRPGYSGIFARFFRESFATEHLVCRSPAQPIYLQRALRVSGRIEVIGMDSSHRLGRWRTLGYFTPPELQPGIFSVQSFGGDYMPVLVTADPPDESGRFAVDSFTGSYTSIALFHDAPDEVGGFMSIDPNIGGSYTSVLVTADPPDESGLFAVDSFAGTYTLVAIGGNGVESGGRMTIEPTITGSYAP